ncbi:MAG: NADH-quinone oxidoreductase subunit I [Leptospiraceae bacterium]|nr:NADH-quinone oxidoreductase subunit I [Leptospiraceae bacterium]
MITVKREKISWLRKFYLLQIAGGLRLTFSHLLKNFFKPDRMNTVFYPEEKKDLPPTTRGRHRLMKREGGGPRCTACMLCATNCPAECIHILAEEVDDIHIEKRPAQFNIDLLRCVFCGLCVEACPLDAIRMDVPRTVFAGYTRESFVLDKATLMDHNNEEFVPAYNPERPVQITHGIHARP